MKSASDILTGSRDLMLLLREKREDIMTHAGTNTGPYDFTYEVIRIVKLTRDAVSSPALCSLVIVDFDFFA